MKKKKHLHTIFVKYIIEKYNKDEEIIDEIEISDEVQDDDDEDTIEDLIKEFNEMEQKYKTVRNDKLYSKK